MGGFASAGSLIAASALGFLNGDYKTAAIDLGGASIQAMVDYDSAPGVADGGQGATISRSTFDGGTAIGVDISVAGLTLKAGHESLSSILTTRGDQENSVYSAEIGT